MKRLLLLLSVLCCLPAAGTDPRNSPLDLSPAKWLWYPCGRTLQNTFVQFRKEFSLESAPVEAKGWILADSRYKLYVNGSRVQFGPAPCDPRWQEADPVDITGYLTAGDNVIAVEVCYFGAGDGTVPFGKPGLIFNLDIDGKKIPSDTSWSCHLCRSWSPGQYKRAFLRSLQESFDARLYPYGWDSPGFVQDEDWVKAEVIGERGDKPSVCTSHKDYLWGSSPIGDNQRIRRRSIPQMKEYRIPAAALEESLWLEWKRPAEDYFDLLASDCYEAVRHPSAKALADGAWTVSPDGGKAAVLTFSFGEQGVGWPYFTIDAPEGTVVEMLVHEAHEPGGPALMNSHFNSWTRFVCREGINRFETFDFESFRWVQLHIRNFNRPVTVSSVGMRRRVYPWRSEPRIRVSDPVIQKVMEAALNTVNNCAQETLVDGMARERQQYSGDGSHQMHPVFQTFGDSALPFRFINTFSQGSSIEGYFMDSWPAWDRLARIIERQMGLSGWGPIIDHSIGFCFDCRHYHMYTGDLSGLEEVYPRLLKFFGYLKGLTDPSSGLVPAEGLGLCSVYIDHLAYKKDRDKQLPLNLYIAAMCSDALGPLCRAMEDTVAAAEVEEYGRRILAGCRDAFWDSSRGVYVTNLPWEKEEGGPRYDDRSLSLALIYDLCPDGKNAGALDILVSRPEELGQCYPCNAVWPLWALAKHHRMDVVLSDLRTRWGAMRSVRDNNTLQEFWTANPDEGSQWSHCAIYPLVALTQGIAGAYPLEPGGRKLRMEPRFGDLEEAEFDVYTAGVPVHIRYAGRKLTLTIPEPICVELHLNDTVSELTPGTYSFSTAPEIQDLEEMTLREKVCQMFIIRPESLIRPDDPLSLEATEFCDSMADFFGKYPAGGFCLFPKNIVSPDRLTAFTASLHNLRPRPLLCIDEEGGRVAHIANTDGFNLHRFGSMTALAAGNKSRKVYNAARYIGTYVRKYGFDIDFAPVADVSTNPENPVIGTRAFSGDPRTAAVMVVNYLFGLRDAGVIGCLKHFPGHGDTKDDTHTGYAATAKTWEEMDTCEMPTFRAGIAAGARMVMAAHIAAPEVTGSKVPASLSSVILQEKLRGELGFEGIIITDALEMESIAKEYSPAEAALEAVKAGADIILMPLDYVKTVEAVITAVEDGVIDESRIDASVRRILALKRDIKPGN